MSSPFYLKNADTDEVVIPNLELATTFWQRFRGWQFRKRTSTDRGILIVPCRSIHTHWMRFAIDVFMLDRSGVVLDICRSVKPWRIVTSHASTHAILETAEGAFSDSSAAGDRLVVLTHGGDSVVPELFLAPEAQQANP